MMIFFSLALLAMVVTFTFYARMTSRAHRADIAEFERSIKHIDNLMNAVSAHPDTPATVMDEGKIIARLDEVKATRDELLNERDDLLEHFENKAQGNLLPADN